MSLLATAIRVADRAPLPDAVTLAIVGALARLRARRLSREPEGAEARFLADMTNHPIVAQGACAKGVADDLPPEFFDLILGPQRNYFCCRYPDAATTLAEAEILALDETIKNAGLCDGQRVLELGSGWGSLALRLAQQFSRATIVCVSSSQAQRRYIEARARERFLPNVIAVAADMDLFAADQPFDRVLSVGMFGRIANWGALLSRVRNWLEPDGRLFLQVVAHRSRSYRFDEKEPIEGLARHFLGGGVMPAQDLPHRFADLFSVEAEWRWSGADYRRTALDWLADFDSNRIRLDEVLREIYGAEAALWRRRWRLFFLIIAGLFGHGDGSEWGVGHYRMAPVAAR
jgi:cyclopropane-fatty-acyl-phospholipid synthase